MHGAREGVAEVLELFAGGQEIDREQVEANRDVVAVLTRKLPQPGLCHQAKLAALAFVDGGFWSGKIAGSAGLDLEDDEGRAVPGKEVDVAFNFRAGPTLGHDSEAEATKMEEGCLLSA